MSTEHRELSRSGFLKMVGTVSLAAASMDTETVVSAAASTADPVRQTVMHGDHFGAFQAVVEQGRVQSVVPYAKDPHPILPMLQALPGRVYSPTRIRYPMIRRGYLQKGYRSDTSERGKGDFVRVSWDDALDLVAAELRRVKSSHGNSAIHNWSDGWSHAGLLHKPNILVSRFLNGYGGFVDGLNDYSTAAVNGITPHVVGSLAANDQQTVWPVVLAHTKLIVLWGCDLITNNEIDFVVPDHAVYPALDALRHSTIRVVSLNPYKTEADMYLGAEWVPLRPGTDVAVMLGMAFVLYTESLHDTAFLATYTTGFDTFREYLLGHTDGTPKTPAWAEKISGVSAQTIAELARAMAKQRTMIMGGWAIQRQQHGEQPPWMLITLASMLGQIGQPGGGFGFSYHASSGGAPSSDGPALAGISVQPAKLNAASHPAWHGQDAHAIPSSRFADMLLHAGKTIDFDGRKLVYPDIKMIYWAGSNPVGHHPQFNLLVEALRHPETIVVHDVFWTPTARFADIVLPVTTTFERNDIASIGLFSNQAYLAMQQAIAPLFEARSDFAIFSDLARRLGFEQVFTEGRDEMGWLHSIYDAARKAASAKKLSMPDFTTFWRQGIVEFPVSEQSKSYVAYADFRADPQQNTLGTPSGRIEITSQAIARFRYPDCPAHPTWLEPAEWLGGAKARQYPLALISPHPRYRLHSQLDNTTMQQTKNKIKGRAPLWINPHDAHTRGLATGDIVRVHNERGQVLAGVVVTNRITPGVVRMEEGTWYDPQQGGTIGSLDKEGSPNTLTLDMGTSRIGQGPIVNTNLVQVEKVLGSLPQVTAYTAPRA